MYPAGTLVILKTTMAFSYKLRLFDVRASIKDASIAFLNRIQNRKAVRIAEVSTLQGGAYRFTGDPLGFYWTEHFVEMRMRNIKEVF
jgi:hypothetical protein